MMIRLQKVAMVGALGLLAACSTLERTTNVSVTLPEAKISVDPAARSESKAGQPQAQSQAQVKELVNWSRTPPICSAKSCGAEGMRQAIESLSEQLDRNGGKKSGEVYILTSFNNLNRMHESSHFGQLVSEGLISGLQTRGWKLIDLRLTESVTVNSAGEFGLSREHRILKDRFQASGLVSGTYSVSGNSVLVNARVMLYHSGAIISSAQVEIPLDPYVEELVGNRTNLPAIRIVGGSSETR